MLFRAPRYCRKIFVRLSDVRLTVCHTIVVVYFRLCFASVLACVLILCNTTYLLTVIYLVEILSPRDNCIILSELSGVPKSRRSDLPV